MKRLICCGLLLCLMLFGCAKNAPQKAADGVAWDESWTTLGGVLGVAEPGNGLELRDNNEALSVTDMYLATWTIGEGAPYINEDGDEVTLYPARLDVLVYGRKDADTARQDLEDWTARQAETYEVSGTSEETCNGQTFTVSIYFCKSETNPYNQGISAFGVYKDYAISVELNCVDSFTGDAIAIMSDFLNSCHKAVEMRGPMEGNTTREELDSFISNLPALQVQYIENPYRV